VTLLPLWMQNAEYAAQADRTLLESLFRRGGVMGVADFLVGPRAAGPNLSVDVAPGGVAIRGTDAPDQMTYLWTSTAVVNVPLEAAPGAGQSRIDLIIANLTDDAVVGGSTRGCEVTKITGAPSADPQPPDPPRSCEVLGEVMVKAGTAQIADFGPIKDRRRMAGAPRRLSEPFVSFELGRDQPAAIEFEIPTCHRDLMVVISHKSIGGAGHPWQHVCAWVNDDRSQSYAGQLFIMRGANTWCFQSGGDHWSQFGTTISEDNFEWATTVVWMFNLQGPFPSGRGPGWGTSFLSWSACTGGEGRMDYASGVLKNVTPVRKLNLWLPSGFRKASRFELHGA
jgi:hypothetical protein